MSVARYWDGAAWQDVAPGPVGPQGPTGPQGPPGPGAILAQQQIVGQEEAYSPAFGGTSAFFMIGVSAALACYLAYTPPVAAWWEVHLHVGLLQKTDAAYHYIYTRIWLTPAPAFGPDERRALGTQHSAVNQFEDREITITYPLAAGVAYQARAHMGAGNGGNWSYYRGAAQLAMEGKAWAR